MVFLRGHRREGPIRSHTIRNSEVEVTPPPRVTRRTRFVEVISCRPTTPLSLPRPVSVIVPPTLTWVGKSLETTCQDHKPVLSREILDEPMVHRSLWEHKTTDFSRETGMNPTPGILSSQSCSTTTSSSKNFVLF